MQPVWVMSSIAQLIRQFCHPSGNAAWIGISSIGPFAGREAGPRAPLRLGGKYGVIAGMHLSEGFVWLPDSPLAEPELWLSPIKTGYRRAFEQFAQRYLGAASLSDASVQIDHVFPKKAGVLGGLSHVRMLAISPDSNMAAGRTLERAMVARNEDLGPRGKENRMATYFAIGKAAGFAGYEQIPGDEESVPNAALAAALMAHLRGFGLPAEVLAPLDRKLIAKRAASLR